MSLTSILTAAGSALTTAQYRMAVSQTNVANVDDETYSRKTVATTATSTTSAVSSGVVTRAADAYLSKAVITTASAASRDSTIDSYMQTYDASLGSVDGGDDISSLLDAFQTALSGLASSSTSASAKAQVVSAASAVASSLNSLSSDIQDLRTQANSEIATTVDSINTSLSTLQSLNDQIVTTTAQGGDTTSLEDQRAAELATLSSMIGITSYLTSDNKVAIYTTSGDQLLGASAAKLSYTASSSLSADTVYPDTISGVMLNGKDITTATTSGSLGALITLRDDTLVGEQDAVDALAGGLIAQVNAVAADTFTGTDAGDIAVSATLLADPSTFTSDAAVASSLLTVLTSDVSFAAAGT
jgi:flagellar hook-associated protein 1 FlgK